MTGLSGLFRFAGALFLADRVRTALLLLFLLLQSALQGLSILMLLPMLSVIGVDIGISGQAGEESLLSAFLALFDDVVSWLPVDDKLIGVLTIFVCALFVRDIINYGASVLRSQLQHEFQANLRSDLYRRLLGASWSGVSKLKSHDIAFHLTSNMSAISNTVFQLMQILNAAVAALAYSALALVAAPLLMLFLAPLAIGLAMPMRHLFRKTRAQAKQVRDLQAAHEDRGQQFVKRHRYITIFGNTDSEATAHDKATWAVAAARVGIAKSQAQGVLVQGIGASVAMALAVFAALRVFDLAAANLLVLIFAASRLLPRLMTLLNQGQSLVSAIPAFESHMALLARLDSRDAKTNGATLPQIDRIDIQGVRVEGRLDLRRADLVLKRGEIVCLTGPSGVGKSTFCDVLSGLLDGEFTGSLNLNTPLQELVTTSGQATAYLEQGTMIWQHSVRAALTWVKPDAADNELIELLGVLGLRERVLSHPLGLDAPLGDAGHWLSGGELKRLALAQALLCDAQILILDEFTANLDSETETQVMDVIEKNRQNRITVIATHRDGPTKFADRVYHLSRQEGSTVTEIELTMPSRAAE